MRTSAPMATAVGFLLLAAAVGPAGAQWLDTTLVLPDSFGSLSGPEAVFHNPVTGRVYVSGSERNALFEPDGFEKVGFLPEGRPVYCAAAGKVYLVSDSLIAVDASADTVVGGFEPPFDLTGVCYSETSNKLYLRSGDRRDPLFVFDPVGDTLLGEVALVSPAMVLAWDSALNRVYVGTDSRSGWVVAVDCVRDSVVGSVATGLYDISGFVVNSTHGKLYCRGGVDSLGAEGIRVLATDSLLVTGDIPRMRNPTVMLYNPLTARLLSADGDESYVYIIDGVGDTILARPALERASAMVVSRTTGKAYVGTRAGVLHVIDAGDSVVARIGYDSYSGGVGALGFSVGFDTLYCALGSGRVFVIDAARDSTIGTIDYSSYSFYHMVWNPAGNKLYALSTSGEDGFVILDSAYRHVKTLPFGVNDRDAFTLLNSALNRIYVVDDDSLWVIDCNRDEVVDAEAVPGVEQGILVLQPELQKLYAFPVNRGDFIWVYDCLREQVVDSIAVDDETPCAVYHPRSGRIYFGCKTPPTVRVLDPVHDTVVDGIAAGNDVINGRMLANPDFGELYFANDRTNRLYTIDVTTDSVIDSVETGWDVDTLFWNRRLGKLYVCREGGGVVSVFDCASRTIIDTILASYRYAGVMNERNDKLYVAGVAVIDCRYDSVVTVLPRPDGLEPRAMAWDCLGNRVYAARGNDIYVYRDNQTGIEEERVGPERFGLRPLRNPVAGAVRLRCIVPFGSRATLAVFDVTGRRVMRRTIKGEDRPVNVTWQRADSRQRAVPPGIYFARLESDTEQATAKLVLR